MNDEPSIDHTNRLHHVLVSLHRLTRVPPVVRIAIALALASLVGYLWSERTHAFLPSWSAGAVYLAAVLVDWAWLAALPKRNVSFGPVEPPWFGLAGVRLLPGLLPLIGHAIGLSAEVCVAIGTLFQLAVGGLVVYATRIEPLRLGVTQFELRTPKLPAGTSVRLVQISDLHVERITQRERDLIRRVNALCPDYILLTGDYVNFSYVGEERAVTDARQVLGALRAREAIYAVRGTHSVDPDAQLPVLFDGLPIRWLQNEHVNIRVGRAQMTFAGASCTRRRDIDVPAVERALAGAPEDTFTVLLFHTPDLVPEAVAKGVDLYLAGHTHGGQLRLPLYGALITGTEMGKRYEMGRYEVEGLTLYVSRGVGMEGMAAPRARFLCPPEIVCIDLKGSAA